MLVTSEPQTSRASGAAIVRLLRPHQWSKNLLCFAGVIFSGHFRNPIDSLTAFLTFVMFCAASSSIYAFNDVMDRERDRKHPIKRRRPVANGAVGARTAAGVSLLLMILALGGAFLLGRDVTFWLGLYILNSFAYTVKLKHVALVDLLSVSIGFVLRLLAGCYAVNVMPTSWIVLCTFFLAMFLAAAKRRAELASVVGTDQFHRPVLANYSVQFLDQLTNNCAAMAIICYALFTIFKNPTLVVTVPIVFYGIMHYKRIMMVSRGGEEPDRVLLTDVRIQLAIVIWLGVFALVVWLDSKGLRLFGDVPLGHSHMGAR